MEERKDKVGWLGRGGGGGREERGKSVEVVRESGGLVAYSP